MTSANDDGTLISALESAKERAEQDFNSMQIVGRALTPDESKRSDALVKCLEFINQAIKTVAENGDENPY
ncbi:MAG: hypothetical protein ACR2MG_07890 [Pyrinomonadaceae bacterium]